MSDESSRLKFHLVEDQLGAKIKVIGLGGGGGNAVNRMIEHGIQGVEFIAVNTDVQALNGNRATTKIQIGTQLTKGLGSGGRPETGQAGGHGGHRAPARDPPGRRHGLPDAGLGGGTGTGATPIIANLAAELDILVIAIVTLPFGFEGRVRAKQAQQGLEELKIGRGHGHRHPQRAAPPDGQPGHLDPGRLPAGRRHPAPGRPGHLGPHHQARPDQPGLRRRQVGHEGHGHGLHGHRPRLGREPGRRGRREGHLVARSSSTRPSRAPTASSSTSPAARTMTLHEVSKASQLIHSLADPDANIIFGTVIDEAMKDTVKVTVIATGFDQPQEKREAADPTPAEPAPARPAFRKTGRAVPRHARRRPPIFSRARARAAGPEPGRPCGSRRRSARNSGTATRRLPSSAGPSTRP